MRIFLVMAMIGFLSGLGVAEQGAPELNLMPMPASVRVGNGALAITPTFSVGIEGYHEAAARARGGKILPRAFTANWIFYLPLRLRSRARRLW